MNGKKCKNFWTEEKIKKEALKYSNRIDFMRNSGGAYRAALRIKKLDEFTFHMKPKWNIDLIKKEALKHTCKSSFLLNGKGAYQKAMRLGVLNQVCSHMPQYRRNKLQESQIIEIAKKFKSRTEFEKKDCSAYRAALRLGILDAACFHMKIKTKEDYFNNHFKKTNNCWEWKGFVDRRGYGRFLENGRIMAHRFSWELYNNKKIPKDRVIDHTCRNRKCVNPKHLRLATFKQNALENSISPSAINYNKKYCIRGHAFDKENTYINPNKPNYRQCIACKRIRSNKYKFKK